MLRKKNALYFDKAVRKQSFLTKCKYFTYESVYEYFALESNGQLFTGIGKM